MKYGVMIMAAMIGVVITSSQAQPVKVTHREVQAVHEDGSSSFDDNGPWQIVLEGLLLNNPEDWLDPTPDPTVAPWYMGGEWEIFVQGEGEDRAGTACWMGQNYANGLLGQVSYSNSEWLEEICRLNRDPNTGYVFRAGDRIRVTGTYLFYAGKLNVNENHQTAPEFDFTVELVTPAVGLPQPVEITLAEIKTAQNQDIFDATRHSGGELYQARRVRIKDVTVIDPENYLPGGQITLSDGAGRTLPVRLGVGAGLSRYSCPAGVIDVIGIVDQASSGYPVDPKKGYRLLVFDHDGNDLVLGASSKKRGNLPGDTNGDARVDLYDLADLAADWMMGRAGLCDCAKISN